MFGRGCESRRLHFIFNYGDFMADIRFGTDGWRGIIAWDFTFDNVRRMAQALANFINVNTPSSIEPKTNLVVIGYDRRFLSDKFAADIASILKLLDFWASYIWKRKNIRKQNRIKKNWII
jgi:phosphomannomutase